MKRHIPDEAVKKESLSSIFKDIFETSAQKEYKAFEEESYGDGIPKAVNSAVKRFLAKLIKSSGNKGRLLVFGLHSGKKS